VNVLPCKQGALLSVLVPQRFCPLFCKDWLVPGGTLRRPLVFAIGFCLLAVEMEVLVVHRAFLAPVSCADEKVGMTHSG